jgi:hypothetical protein
MKMLNLTNVIEMYQNFEMDEIHVTLNKLNMDEIGPTSGRSCNKGKIYYTETPILKMVNITHKQKRCKEEIVDQMFNALNLEPKKCVDVSIFMVAMDQMHIH